MIINRATYKFIFKKILLLLFFTLVFLYDYFVTYISFIDELVAVLFIGSILFVRKIKLLKLEITILGLLIFVLILGLLSNLMTEKTIVYKAIVLDILSFYKAFIAYFGVRIFFRDISWVSLYPSLKKLAQISFFVLLVFILMDLVFHVFPKASRFGIKSLELFFTHPSRLSFAISFIFIILYPYYINKWKTVLVFILIVGMVTLRVKYFGFVFIMLFFIFYKNIIARVNVKYIYTFIALLPIALFFIFKEWILFYFSDEAIKLGWSRAVLLKHGFVISYDFFPLGTGFGSYGSFFSGPNYSWVYQHYDIHKVWGIMPKYHQFIADQYWPMVLGQFGVFGLLAMLGVIVSFISILLSFFKAQNDVFLKNTIIAGLLGLIVLLIDSSSDAIFSQNRGVVIFMLIALVINAVIQQQNKAEKS